MIETGDQPSVDLEALEKELAANIDNVGKLLHGGLQWLKMAKIADPDARVPRIDTHLAFALQLRAQATAHLLVTYAAKNDQVMRAIQGFNGIFKGGEGATVIASLGLAALATVGAPAPSMLQVAFNADIVAAVDQETQQLQAMVDQARAQAARPVA